MGVNIDLHVYNLPNLLADMDKFAEGRTEGKLTPREFFNKIADSFGVVSDGKFFVVWNEYYEDYNPARNFLEAVTLYYGEKPTDKGYGDDFWSDHYSTKSEGANAREVLEELGLEYEDLTDDEY